MRRERGRKKESEEQKFWFMFHVLKAWGRPQTHEKHEITAVVREGRKEGRKGRNV